MFLSTNHTLRMKSYYKAKISFCDEDHILWWKSCGFTKRWNSSFEVGGMKNLEITKKIHTKRTKSHLKVKIVFFSEKNSVMKILFHGEMLVFWGGKQSCKASHPLKCKWWSNFASKFKLVEEEERTGLRWKPQFEVKITFLV